MIGPVLVIVTSNGVPAPGIDLLFSGADGEVIEARQTDEHGEASATMGGGSITVATYDPDLESYELMTVHGVEPSDRIQVELSAYAVPKLVGTGAMVLPGRVDGAVSYEASIGCASTKTADPKRVAPLEIRTTCLAGGKLAANARAIDANGHPLAYSVKAGLRPKGAATKIAMPRWRTDFDRIAVQVIDAPGKARVSIDPLGMLGDAGEGELKVPRLGAEYEVTLTIEARTLHRLEKRAKSYAVDAKELLPRTIDVGWDASDEHRPILKFRFDGDPSGADATWAGISWGQPKPRLNWSMVGPPRDGPLRAPILPPSLSAWLPSGKPVSMVVTLFDRSSLEWRDVRTAPTGSMRYAVVRAPQDRVLRTSQGRFRADQR